MTNHEGREILALFRPGTADERDAAFDQARQLAKTDPDLARWFDQHCQAYLVLRRKFQSIPIPPGLMEQILSEQKIRRPFFQKYSGPLWAAAAAVALLLSIESGFWTAHFSSGGYPAYRKRMTESALRGYNMELTQKDPDLIRHYFMEKNAPANYSLPAGLKSAAVAGCAVSSWQKNPVSMICFQSGRPLPPGDQSDLWLFVIDRKAVDNAPANAAPVFARVNKATTASWSDGEHSYLLAAVGDEAFLRKYLQ